jgi:hypothetical protein
MRDGNIVVKIETNNGRGEKVLEGSPEVAQTLSTNLPVKVCRSPGWGWIYITLHLRLALCGSVPTPTSSLYMDSRLWK